MGRNLDDIINSLPVERQTAIAAASGKKIEDMLAHAATLTDFRKAVGKTQAEVAKDLGINQNAVSQLEKRSDTYVSTLRRFLKSLGLTLELSVLDKHGRRFELPDFFGFDADVGANEAIARSSAARVSARKTAPKNASAETGATKEISSRKVSGTVQAPTAEKKRARVRAKVRAPA
ncbi:XRE family transcriptional regulator [Massilia violaceinigra]|uniref:XRE family transcriptional regulator n=1 Tax=Massilia violaceinigra TaxID=2045208 RepID=A0ABY4AD15_9BURK|nr:XRE family transcriptional regulator [Massilia violaceinigra]UOD32691.1 XRE family transcriptional regulator [Massilia violaceinigra]